MAEKKVKLFVEPTPGDTDPNFVIGVNGKLYILPKGKTSNVPEAVAYEYERAMKARRYRYEHANNLIEKNREKEAESAQAAQA